MNRLIILAILLLFATAGYSQTEKIDLQELLISTNQQRAKYGKKATKKRPGCEPLTWNETLAEAARVQANYLLKKKKLTHTGSNGSSVDSRVKKLGYNWRFVGENLAKGQETIDEVIKSWMLSPGHRKNILNPDYKEFGAAVVMDKDGQLIWAQVFGTK